MADPTGDDLLAIAEDGVGRAKAKGADAAEAYACHQSNARVEFRGRLGEVQETLEGGVSVRVSLGGRLGFAGSPGLGNDSLERAIERALENARNAPVDARFRHYADPQPVTAPPTRIDARVAEPEADRILADAKDAAAAVEAQADVTYVSFQLSATRVRFGVANDRGVAAWDQDARESFLSEMRVSKGSLHKTSNDFGCERIPLSERHDLGKLMHEAAARARAALVTKPLDGLVDTVVFDAITAAQALGPFLDNLQLAAARPEGLAEKLGARVASGHVTIHDTPQRADGPRAQRVDDEGVPTRTTRLIDQGVLRELVTNSYVAHHKGAPPTGNGFRAFDNRWSGGPRPRLASVDVAPGAKTLDALLAGVDRAVYVRDMLLGFFTNNPVTGDFSTVAPLAYLVEKGSIVQALPPTTVAGNVFRMMEGVEDVSRERRTVQRGTFPAMRVRGLTCAN